jgi:hypothetical protein
LTGLVVARPEAIVILPALIVGTWLFTRDRGVIRGYALGVGVAILVVAGSNSAPTAIRIVAVAVATVVMLAGATRGDRAPGRLRSATPLWLAYLAYAAVVTIVAGSSSIPTVVAALAAPAAAAFVASKMSASDLLAFTKVLVALSAAQVVICVLEVAAIITPMWGYRNVTATGEPVLRFNPFLGDAILRAQGSLGHPILLALLMLMTFFLSISRITDGSRVLRASGVAVSLAGLVLSGTRSAAIAFAVAFVYFAISAAGFGRRTRNLMLLVAVAALALTLDFGLQRVVIDLLESDSLGHRVDGWTAASELLSREVSVVIFGSGINSESSVFLAGYLQQDGFNVIDNQFITAFVTTGALGVTFLFACLIFAWVRTTRDGRTLLLSVVVMFFSFDLSTWPISLAMLSIPVCLPREVWVCPPKYLPLRQDAGARGAVMS